MAINPGHAATPHGPVKIQAEIPVEITPELRLTAARPVDMTPGQALPLAERLTLAAMMRQAAMMPARRSRRVRSAGLMTVAA